MPNSPGIRTRSWSSRAPRGDRTGNAGASRGGSPAAERRVRRRAILLVAGRVFLVMLGRGSGRPLYAGEHYVRGGSGEIKTSDVREQCEGRGRIEVRCTAASHAEGRQANSRITNEGNEIVFGNVSCPGRYARTREAPFTLLFLGNSERRFRPFVRPTAFQLLRISPSGESSSTSDSPHRPPHSPRSSLRHSAAAGRRAHTTCKRRLSGISISVRRAWGER